jgi:GntR family transcriptional regulator
LKIYAREKPGIQNGDKASLIARELAIQMELTRRTTLSTKRTAARIAILNVIRSNIVGPGELLPSEIELTKILEVSLGTVQAALRGLQDIGTIVRRRGDGTRVASGEPFGEAIWHFRFVSRDDGTPLRFIDQKTWVDKISTHGIWSNHLGQCTHYVRIRRILTLQNNVHVGAEMFLDSSAEEGLENIVASELIHINIRPYLKKTFGLSVMSATHFVQTTELNEKTTKVFDLSSEEIFYEIHAKTFSTRQEPIYFQRIYVSTDDCALIF